MKFLDLFAGVGGIRLGMEQAGHECVGWVKWDKFARKSYQAIHDTTNEWTATDINEVNATDIPRANVWCFGFPCQDISLAGKQGGFTNGKRSSLFFTVTGLIKQLKEDGDPEFTLTVQDRHGIYNGLRIRKLTPKECWRLQGFPDWAFDKAQEAGFSNSQLYKQAGNSVTVPVIKAIAERLSEEEEK